MEENIQVSSGLLAMGLPIMIVYFTFLALMIVSGWKVFTKAGLPGWGIFVPVWNMILCLKMAGKPAWWFLLFLIPLANFVVLIILPIKIAENFGKSTGFGIGLLLLPFIFYPILAFGSAEYKGVMA